MDFTTPSPLSADLEQYKTFLGRQVVPNLAAWYRQGAVPRSYYLDMAEGGWLGFTCDQGRLGHHSKLREALLFEQLAEISPGLAIATLVPIDLGIVGLWLFGSELLLHEYGPAVVEGKRLMCLGHTEAHAGSDAAAIATRAEPVTGGWLLNGTKAYVTGGSISDLALLTAVSHPQASRSDRLSMFLVDLAGPGIERKKLNKQVWIPSDLTRVKLTDVFVPADHLLGRQGKGLQQLLTIFTHSRVAISALTLGTARGAFDLALAHARKRKIFGRSIVEHQAKAFEIADFHARIEAAWLMILKACWKADTGLDFQLEASMAKYLSVAIAREVASWAADLFGAASVMSESPIHKYPMDAWASSLGEGTQDVQKLIIFRRLMAGYGRGD